MRFIIFSIVKKVKVWKSFFFLYLLKAHQAYLLPNVILKNQTADNNYSVYLTARTAHDIWMLRPIDISFSLLLFWDSLFILLVINNFAKIKSLQFQFSIFT